MLITVFVSIPFFFVLTSLLWINYNQVSFFRQRAPRLIGILLLAALASCSPSMNRGPTGWGMPRENVPSSSLSPRALSPPALKSSDWPTYHHDNARTGYLPNEPDPKQLIPAWTAKLDNAVYAEPLAIGGRVIVATIGDSLYSLDARTGKVQWRTTIGNPVPLSS